MELEVEDTENSTERKEDSGDMVLSESQNQATDNGEARKEENERASDVSSSIELKKNEKDREALEHDTTLKEKHQEDGKQGINQESQKGVPSMVWWYGMIQGRRYNIKRTADGCSNMTLEPYSLVIPSLPVYFGRMGKVEKEMCEANKKFNGIKDNSSDDSNDKKSSNDENKVMEKKTESLFNNRNEINKGPRNQAEGGFYLPDIGYYIPLSDSVNVSRWHAKLHYEKEAYNGTSSKKGAFRLTCLSKNGIVVDNCFLMPGEWCYIKENGSILKIGSTDINIHLVIGEGIEEPIQPCDVVANKVYIDRLTGAKKRAIFEPFLKEELLKTAILPRFTPTPPPLTGSPPIPLPNNANELRVKSNSTPQDNFLNKVAAVLKVPPHKLSGKSNLELAELIEQYGNNDESLPEDVLGTSNTSVLQSSPSNVNPTNSFPKSNSYSSFSSQFDSSNIPPLEIQRKEQDMVGEGSKMMNRPYIPPFPVGINMAMNPPLNFNQGLNFPTSSPQNDIPVPKKRKRSTNVTDEVYKEVSVNKKGLPFYEYQVPQVPLTYYEYVRVACLSPELYEQSIHPGLTSFEITKWIFDRYDEWVEPIERKRQFMNGVQNILTRKFERSEESSPRLPVGTPGQKGARWVTLPPTRELFAKEREKQINDTKDKNIECYPFTHSEPNASKSDPTP